MDYGPKFKKTILEAGDEYAIHSGGKGGLRIGSMQAISTDNALPREEPVVSPEDPSLAPWVTWLDEVGFENLWDDKS
jgi:hypothetical protein